MSSQAPVKAEFKVEIDGRLLAGESVGEGPAVITAHGVTATRRYLLHGSVALARAGYRQVMFDARGHGESDPPPPGGGYSYRELADDLGEIIAAEGGGGPVVLAGHSMGAHTIVNRALRHPEGLAGLVLVGPVQAGGMVPESAYRYWNRLADGLESGGIDGFMAAYDRHLDPRWRETILRFTRQRISDHRHPEALIAAMRQMPDAQPFADIAELERIEIPTLVVASHDDADPGHPYAVSEAYAGRIPGARLLSEAPGESPLAWQGGKLSREIATFCGEIGF